MEYRTERDSMGEVSVPVNKYWAAQTQRSLENFPIGEEKMPFQIIKAFSLIKKACALTNNTLGKLDDERCDIICKVCEEIEKGGLDGNFPLSVWQTGSGTQSNMNVNEVIAGRGNELAGKKLLHPNDHVNMSQSSNDTFPTAMHIAAYTEVTEKLIPSIDKLIYVFEGLEDENRKVIKIGRTHLQDAVPLSFSQEISAWRTMLVSSKESILLSLSGLLNLALGATAVGTGLNAPKDFDKASASKIAEISGHPFVSAKNKFHALSSKDEITFAHGALKALAADLMKIANDIRWLSSGPRCGLGEITIPENEPGSSIMPGKVNPTQCEALTMVAARVMGNDVCIGIAASQGNFQLNVYMPLIAYSFLQSVTLLADSINSFCDRCALGIKANEKRMNENLNRSLMLVTALSPHIGYDKAAEAAKKAHSENISLKEAVLSLGYMTADEFDSAAVPEKMV